MAMVGVDSGSLYRWTHSRSCLAWLQSTSELNLLSAQYLPPN